jgi:transcriptional regulator with XRE-family HTH domain
LADAIYPAREFMRASIARAIIMPRRLAGWSQAELARRAGMQPAVLNRIEKAKVDAEIATVDKIMAASGAANKNHGPAGRHSKSAIRWWIVKSFYSPLT